jgi:hypothetical protein
VVSVAPIVVEEAEVGFMVVAVVWITPVVEEDPVILRDFKQLSRLVSIRTWVWSKSPGL